MFTSEEQLNLISNKEHDCLTVNTEGAGNDLTQTGQSDNSMTGTVSDTNDLDLFGSIPQSNTYGSINKRNPDFKIRTFGDNFTHARVKGHDCENGEYLNSK